MKTNNTVEVQASKVSDTLPSWATIIEHSVVDITVELDYSSQEFKDYCNEQFKVKTPLTMKQILVTAGIEVQ